MLTAISLYTGVGGLDFGFEAAGFRTAVAVEFDPIACRTLRLNRNWPIIEGDIHDVGSRKILKVAGLKAGEADVLIGGPPCQPFSKSSYWVNGDSLRLDDPRADTLTSYLRVLRDTRPKAFLLENVSGIAFNKKDEGLKCLLEGVAQINKEIGTAYSLHWKKLDCSAYGVPQMRERIFLVGHRDGGEFRFPDPTHGRTKVDSLFKSELLPYKTAWDAIGDLAASPNDPSLIVGGKWGDLLPSIPEGWNYLWHTNRGGGLPLFGWRTRYWSFLLKLAKNHPSWTIQAQPGTAIGPFRWDSRRLTAQEMCRLQTFPKKILFDCGRTNVQKMIGNAVPSLMTEILGKEIRRQFFNHRNVSRKLKLISPVRDLMPEQEPVKPVPRCFNIYIGDHDDHPGEGKGSAALQRKNY